MKDYQRSKVYKWERATLEQHAYNRKLTLQECQELVDDLVYWHYNIDRYRYGAPKTPLVTDGRASRRARYDPITYTIRLPKWTRTIHYVCHETAHAIVGNQRGNWHGPRFVQVFIDLLEFCGWNRDRLEAEAIDMDVDIK